MRGLIIEISDAGYVPSLNEAFEVLGNEAHKYNWLLSNYECVYYPSMKIPFGELFVWLSGSELSQILDEYEHHFIWGVATAYPKGVAIEEVLQFSIPFADGYTGFWTPSVTMQNPLAEMEIVPWDGTLLLVMARSKAIIEAFVKEYPNAHDLAEYNRR